MCVHLKNDAKIQDCESMNAFVLQTRAIEQKNLLDSEYRLFFSIPRLDTCPRDDDLIFVLDDF